MSTPLRIVHVEDDHLLADRVAQEIRNAFPQVSIEPIRTESEFRSRLRELGANPPALLIMDVMLRWTDPAPDMPRQPDEVQSEGRFRAGLRCQRLLFKLQPLLPVIFYTVLEKNDLQMDLTSLNGKVVYVAKSHDMSILFNAIRDTTATGFLAQI